MLHHPTQLLIVALATTIISATLRSQDTKKASTIDPLARAVRNYEKQLGQLEALLKRQLSAGDKASSKGSQSSKGRANGNSKAVQLQITTALKAAATAHEQQLRAQHKQFTDLEVRYTKLQEQSKQAKAALTKALATSGQAQRATRTAKARSQQLEAHLATQKSLAEAAARARSAAETRLKTLQATRSKTARQPKSDTMATERLQALLASTQKQLRAAETDLNERLTKAEAALAQAQDLIAENREQARLLTQSQRREDALKKELQQLRKKQSDTQKPAAQTKRRAGKTRDIHIHNQGGTVIIHRASDGSASSRKQTSAKRAKKSPQHSKSPQKTSRSDEAGQAKRKTKKRRQTKGAATSRRINN